MQPENNYAYSHNLHSSPWAYNSMHSYVSHKMEDEWFAPFPKGNNPHIHASF